MTEARPHDVLTVMGSLQVGGAERQMILLLEHLDRARFAPSLCLLLPGGELRGEVPADVPVIDLDKRSAADAPRLVAQLAAVIRRRRPAVIFAKVDYTNIITAAAGRLSGTGAPLILGEESIQSVALAHAQHRRVRRAALRWSYRRAAVVTAPSPGVVTDLVAELALSDATFAVIPNMVDLRAIELAAAAPARHAFSERDLPLLVAAGRLAPGKGQADLLAALALINRTRPTNLLVLSTGPDRQRLERLAGELGVAERVAFTGFVPNPFALMRQADAFVSPSHSESFGNVIVEAMAAGVPVVSTRVPHGPETIIVAGETGLFARAREPEDLAAQVESLLADPARARALAARARAAAARYDVNVVARRYEDLLQRHAGERPATGKYRSPRAHRG
jgi:glycosyltransferase involved in cell wall biosynthesis